MWCFDVKWDALTSYVSRSRKELWARQVGLTVDSKARRAFTLPRSMKVVDFAKRCWSLTRCVGKLRKLVLHAYAKARDSAKLLTSINILTFTFHQRERLGESTPAPIVFRGGAHRLVSPRFTLPHHASTPNSIPRSTSIESFGTVLRTRLLVICLESGVTLIH